MGNVFPKVARPTISARLKKFVICPQGTVCLRRVRTVRLAAIHKARQLAVENQIGASIYRTAMEMIWVRSVLWAVHPIPAICVRKDTNAKRFRIKAVPNKVPSALEIARFLPYSGLLPSLSQRNRIKY